MKTVPNTGMGRPSSESTYHSESLLLTLVSEVCESTFGLLWNTELLKCFLLLWQKHLSHVCCVFGKRVLFSPAMHSITIFTHFWQFCLLWSMRSNCVWIWSMNYLWKRRWVVNTPASPHLTRCYPSPHNSLHRMKYSQEGVNYLLPNPN